MRNINKWVSFLMFFSILFTSCKQDDIHIDLENSDDYGEVGLGLPFAKINFKLGDFLDDIDEEVLYIDENGMISLRYREEVFINWKKLVLLKDTITQWNFSTLKSSVLKSESELVFTERIQLNHRPDVRYDSLIMNQGFLNLELNAPSGTSGEITVTIPEILNANREPVQFQFIVSPESHFFSIPEYSLANHEVHFQQDPDEIPGEEFSFISVETEVNLNVVVPESEGGDVQLNFGLSSMQPELTFGYFGVQESDELNASLTFDAFEELDLIDEIEFGDFILGVEVENSIGVPFFVVADNVRFYKEKSAEPDQYDWILNLFNGDELSMDVSTALYGPPVFSQTSLLDPKINKSNSNIVDIGNRYPVKMLCDLYAISNPENDGNQNFMGVIDQIKADLLIEIPMWFRTERYSRKDTIDFDFIDIIGKDEDEVRRLNEVNLYFDFTSRMPVDVTIEAWVVDAEGNKIATIIESSRVIPAATIGEDYNVISPVLETFIVGVNRDQINKFIDEKAMEIIFETTLRTPENGEKFIKLFEQSGLEAVFTFDLKGQFPKL